ncbi:MAG: hypothetical protein OXC02_08225 [Rhodobacteraceae bacterium]|nr:hypothetical protein [Paracoccaceae bacterium]
MKKFKCDSPAGQANRMGNGFASNGTVIIDGCGFPECWTTHVGLGSRSWAG